MTTRIATLGTCVSSDWYHFQNPSQRIDARILPFQPSSLISLTAKPIDTPIDGGDLKQQEIDRLRADFDKSFLATLVDFRPDLLIVEVLGDARRGLVPVNDSWATRNFRVEKSPMHDRFSTTKPFTAINRPEEYFKLFRDASRAFRKYVDDRLRNCQIVLHHARWAEYYVDEDNELRSYKPKTQNEYFVANLRLEILEKIFSEEVACSHIKIDDVPIFADNRHIWGPGAEHYIKPYYVSFIQQLRGIINNRSSG